jgi:hypothetical protein
MCKAHKRGHAMRWKPRELIRLQEAERTLRRATYR